MKNLATFRLLALTALLCSCTTTWDAPQNRDRHGPSDTDSYIEMLESQSRVDRLDCFLVLPFNEEVNSQCGDDACIVRIEFSGVLEELN